MGLMGRRYALSEKCYNNGRRKGQWEEAGHNGRNGTQWEEGRNQWEEGREVPIGERWDQWQEEYIPMEGRFNL
jgi:hypothetical protein